MKKFDYAWAISNSEIYDGAYTITELMKLKKEQLKDMFNEMIEAEEDYYDSIYG